MALLVHVDKIGLFQDISNYAGNYENWFYQECAIQRNEQIKLVSGSCFLTSVLQQQSEDCLCKFYCTSGLPKHLKIPNEIGGLYHMPHK